MAKTIRKFDNEKYYLASAYKFKIDAADEAIRLAKKGKRYRIIDTGKVSVLDRYHLFVTQKNHKPKVWKW